MHQGTPMPPAMTHFVDDLVEACSCINSELMSNNTTVNYTQRFDKEVFVNCLQKDKDEIL